MKTMKITGDEMSKPTTVTLSAKQQQKALSMFKGSKSIKATKNARVIAKELNVSRYQIMAFLEKSKLTTYSVGSYD